MGFWGFLLSTFAIFGAIIWWFAARASLLGREMDDAIKSLDDFSPGQYVRDAHQAFVVEQGERRVALLARRGGEFESRILPIEDIVSVAIYEDGNSIMETSRSSQVGGALVGGLIGGGVGAVIGGLSGQSTIRQKVSEITLRIVVDDMQRPLCDIHLMQGEIERSDPLYKDRSETARKWHGIVCILIRRVESAARSRQTPLASSQQSAIEVDVAKPPLIELAHQRSSSQQIDSVADEIRKLKALLDDGLISDAQFKARRDRLLGGE